MTRVLTVDPDKPAAEAIAEAAAYLREGRLVAFPTETVYGLGANALDPQAVERIFIAKGRPFQDPLIVHITGLDMLAAVTRDIPPLALELARRFWPGPLTLVLPRHPRVPAAVSAGLDTVAVRMPDHPVARALIEQASVPVAAPSANRFGRTSPTSAAHVLADLESRIELILDGGSPPVGIESTVLDLTQTPPIILRPGGVSREALQAVIGEVALRSQAAPPGEQAAMPSPGMLERHYAPRATLVLFEFDEPLEARRRMLAEADRLSEAGKHVGILAVDEDQPFFTGTSLVIAALGPASDLTHVAQRLYAAIRELDQAGVDYILARSYGRQELGLAILDRLRRAASRTVQ